MRIHWTVTAQKQLDSIYCYIASSSVKYAKQIVDRLTKRSWQISEFPMSGRMVPEFELAQIREVIEGPYRIVYRIKPDQIDILAILHGARNDLRGFSEN
ncbi:MAG: type II toxin-antitoxin system RelE/ParE family toxin [Candidatus Sumerlaeota bacterium]|nr:type II toxin-antitoxin system RelE/ParE family toxin [Candidatus Sumerlaeota bacterium]